MAGRQESTMPKMPEEMTWDQLVGEYNDLKLGHGGLRTKDIQYKHALEDEIHFRETKGYVEMTPQEIEDEMIETKQINERYLNKGGK